jgi:soluble lytic murein transglycosylase-like protein
MEWDKVKQQVLKKPSLREWLMLAIGALIVLLGVFIVALIKQNETPLSSEKSTITSPWIPSTVKQYEKTIDEMAKKYDIDPNLVAIIITMESGGYAKAKSEVGAEGLMQIMPETGKDIAAKYIKKPVKKYDLQDPRTSIEFGTAYLAMLRDEYGTAEQGPSWNSTVELIAAAYNGGFSAANAVENGEGLNDTQTVVYSRDAFNMWRERHAQKSPTFERWKERGGQELIDKANQQ